MNREEVIKIAREAGFESHDAMINYTKELQRFAALVAAAEREACAKEADKWIGCDGLAAAIRARGQ